MSSSETSPTEPANASAGQQSNVDVERRAFEENWQRAESPPATEPARQRQEQISVPVIIGAWELVIGAIAIALWFLLFAGGILIATQPYRDQLNGAVDMGSLAFSWLMVLCFWTITNIGMLSCLSAILGALGRRTRFTVLAAINPSVQALPQQTRGALVFYYSAVMRGFAIYALVMAGLMVLATKALAEPEQGEYLRIAATMSILSFYAGYDPQMFGVLLSRVKRLFESPTD